MFEINTKTLDKNRKMGVKKKSMYICGRYCEYKKKKLKLKSIFSSFHSELKNKNILKMILFRKPKRIKRILI